VRLDGQSRRLINPRHGGDIVTSPRTVVIAGAGIGGLTAAIALAKRGFSVSVVEQADQLEAIGAGIQLSPNASRVLIDLGLGDRLAPHVVAPHALNIMNARSGRVLARALLGEAATAHYGAPYWVIHRGDLHTVLRDAVDATPLANIQLGLRVQDIAVDSTGVVVGGQQGQQRAETRGDILIGADGLWSQIRERLGHDSPLQFAGHTAWRTLVPAEALSPVMRAPTVNLWLGRQAHFVHYPVRGGAVVNVVAIVRDHWREPGWSAAGDRDEIAARFPPGQWYGPVRELVGAAEQWQKWALYDCRPFRSWGTGAATLLGDAAHPMLPFLAQGAAMAIEDSAVLAACLAQTPDDAPTALRTYEEKRQHRTARVQRAARRNGMTYHMGGAEAVLRSLALLAMRGSGLLRHYDWLYRWQPD
jgi:salicylate hydroxylase